MGEKGELVWAEWGSEAGVPQGRLLLLLEPRELSEGGASLPLTSDLHCASVIGLDMVASEGGAKSQNT